MCDGKQLQVLLLLACGTLKKQTLLSVLFTISDWRYKKVSATAFLQSAFFTCGVCKPPYGRDNASDNFKDTVLYTWV